MGLEQKKSNFSRCAFSFEAVLSLFILLFQLASDFSDNFTSGIVFSHKFHMHCANLVHTNRSAVAWLVGQDFLLGGHGFDARCGCLLLTI